jgi:hypothetical protein
MMTDQRLRALARLAAEVATCAPLRHNDYTPSALIPWPVIDAIRQELDGAGIDWRAARKAYEKALRDARRERAKRRA